MSNEELVQLYYQGDPDALSQLCQKNEKLIISLAYKTAGNFNYRDPEELCSVGILAFIELLNSRSYDPGKSMLSTYIFPHIQGAMHRFLEKNTGSIALTKYQMDLIRKAQRLYHETNLVMEAVATELGISTYRAEQLINHNTHAISLEQLFEDERECPFSEPMEYTVLKNIQLELLEGLFRKLAAKDQYILGSYLGVYGYEQKSADKLAFEEMLTLDGIYKAKEAALERLQKLCLDSPILLWRRAYKLTKHAVQNL
jgi:DNA-directed RNA polymerase specialized sigma subunit